METRNNLDMMWEKTIEVKCKASLRKGTVANKKEERFFLIALITCINMGVLSSCLHISCGIVMN